MEPESEIFLIELRERLNRIGDRRDELALIGHLERAVDLYDDMVLGRDRARREPGKDEL